MRYPSEQGFQNLLREYDASNSEDRALFSLATFNTSCADVALLYCEVLLYRKFISFQADMTICILLYIMLITL